MKVCNVCKEEKPFNEFYKDRTTKDGFSRRCKNCDSKKTKEFRSRPEAIEAEKKRTSSDKFKSYRKKESYKIKHRIRNRERKMKLKGIPLSEIDKWVTTQKMECYWCHKECKDDYHIDHYIPLSKGGSHSIDNFVIACSFCNISKGAKMPSEFIEYMKK